MTKIWILVANASEARIYQAEKARLINNLGDLQLIDELIHPASRQKAHDITSDRAGNYSNNNSSHGTLSEHSDPKENEACIFARSLADILETGRLANQFQEIIMVAPPHFQGLLRKQCNHQLSSLVNINIDKDYTKARPNVLMQHLGEHL